MPIPDQELVSLQRSVAMLSPGADVRLQRETMYEVLTELLECRALLARLGGDLRTGVAFGTGA